MNVQRARLEVMTHPCAAEQGLPAALVLSAVLVPCAPVCAGWYEKKAKEMDCPEGAPEGTCKGKKKRVAIE